MDIIFENSSSSVNILTLEYKNSSIEDDYSKEFSENSFSKQVKLSSFHIIYHLLNILIYIKMKHINNNFNDTIMLNYLLVIMAISILSLFFSFFNFVQNNAITRNLLFLSNNILVNLAFLNSRWIIYNFRNEVYTIVYLLSYIGQVYNIAKIEYSYIRVILSYLIVIFICFLFRDRINITISEYLYVCLFITLTIYEKFLPLILILIFKK